MPSLPRNSRASLDPIASRRLSVSVSTRDTKKLATECTFDGSPPEATSRSSPSRYTSTTSSYRSEEHTSELQSPCNLVCRLLLEKKNKNQPDPTRHHHTPPEHLPPPALDHR